MTRAALIATTVLVMVSLPRPCLAAPSPTTAPGSFTRLVYQVVATTSADSTGETPAARMIKVLKDQVDPGWWPVLAWRAIGDDRIEIVTPRLSPELQKLKDARDRLRQQLLAAKVDPAELDHILSMTPRERQAKVVPYDESGKSWMETTLAKYPPQAEIIKTLVDASDAWKKASRRLDDPEDVKRMLAGRGIIEFHIVVSPDEVPKPDELLDDKGNIKKFENPGADLAWVQADPALVGRSGCVNGNRLGQDYVLVHTAPEKSMTHTAGKDWRFTTARPIRDQWNSPAIAFQFDERGGEMFGELTGNNIKKPLCAAVDGKVISIATIQSKIGAQGQITGSFSQDEARILAEKMQAGALPGSLKLISEETIK